MSANRIPRDLAENDYHVRKDPGDTGVLHVDMSHVTYALVSAAAETRVLGTPQRAGIRITVSMQTDGGDITLSTAGDETILDGTTVGVSVTLDDASDCIDLVSFRGASGVYHWLVTGNNGCTLNAA